MIKPQPVIKKSVLEGDELIANQAEIQKFRNITNCHICTELLILSRDPQLCFECQQAIYCKSCIEKCLGKKNECPYCRHESPRIVPISDNQNLLGLLKTVKLYCKFKPLGCEEIMDLDQCEKHEAECGSCKNCNDRVIKKDMHKHFASECLNFNMSCHFCGVFMLRRELKEHRCYQMDFGPKKGGPDYYLTDKRVVDMSKNKKQYESLRCFVCSNLARNPKQCSNTKC